MAAFQHNRNTIYLCVQLHPLINRGHMELAAVCWRLKEAKRWRETSGKVAKPLCVHNSVCRAIRWFWGCHGSSSVVRCAGLYLFPSLLCGKNKYRTLGWGDVSCCTSCLTWDRWMLKYRAAHKMFPVMSKVPRWKSLKAHLSKQLRNGNTWWGNQSRLPEMLWVKSCSCKQSFC